MNGKIKKLVSSACAVVGLLLMFAWSENLAWALGTKVAALALLLIGSALLDTDEIKMEA